mgnify:CR=1 FL=1
MAIPSDSVKLYESQVLTDDDDGGGRATGTEIQDGQVNNLFPDVSRLDRTVGDVALRKAFLGIDTDSADTYLGAHAILSETPADENVDVVIFDAGTESDRRTDAQDRIESYVVRGARASFELLGNQYVGQRQIACIQMPDRQIPATGDVFLLLTADESAEQYVRVTEVEHEVLQYTYQGSSGWVDFEARRLVLGISAPLEATFWGGEPMPGGTTGQASTGQDKSEVFSTEVADAARYYGTQPIVDAVNPGDVRAKVESVYAHLVPSAQSETPFIDLDAVLSMSPTIEGDVEITMRVPTHLLDSDSYQLYAPRSVVPGSFFIDGSSESGFFNYDGFADNGDGTLEPLGGATAQTRTIDYDTGLVQLLGDNHTRPETVNIRFRVAIAAPAGKPLTYAYPVTLSSRSFNYTVSYAAAKPRAGTLVASYMVMGRWYELRDPGAGILEGDGSGSVNFQTGSVLLTLLALPDVGTSVIVQYVADLDTELKQHTGAVSAAPTIEIALQPGVNPGSLTVEYTAGGTLRTLTDDSGGALTGDGVGEVIYGTGACRVTPSLLPDDGTQVTATYDVVTTPQTTAAPAVTDYYIQGTIPNAPLKPGSVTVVADVRRMRPQQGAPHVLSLTTARQAVRDDGAGGWSGSPPAGSAVEVGPYRGTINYATGEYVLIIERPYRTRYLRPTNTYESV